MDAACRKAIETSLWAHFVARVHANGPSAWTKRKRPQRQCRWRAAECVGVSVKSIERAHVAPQQRTRILLPFCSQGRPTWLRHVASPCATQSAFKNGVAGLTAKSNTTWDRRSNRLSDLPRAVFITPRVRVLCRRFLCSLGIQVRVTRCP
jgi:hypothetical protein